MYSFYITHFALWKFFVLNIQFLFHSLILILLLVNQRHLFFNKIFKIKKANLLPHKGKVVYLAPNKYIYSSSPQPSLFCGYYVVDSAVFILPKKRWLNMSGQLCLWTLAEGVPAHISSSSW